MAEEETIIASAMETTDHHKRKLEDLEPEAPQPTSSPHIETHDSKTDLNADEAFFAASVGSEAKRYRVNDKPDGVTVGENGHQLEKVDEDVNQLIPENVHLEGAQDVPKENEDIPKKNEDIPKENEDIPKGNEDMPKGNEDMPKETHDIVDNEDSETDNHEVVGIQPPYAEKPELEITDKPVVDEVQQLNNDVPQEEDVSHAEQHATSETVSRKIDVPNNKVGVLIGKAGDTIRMLQYNSGAKIQIMRDLDADPHAPTRPVELTGSLENINKAEKLIRDVIAEADAGGSPSLVARGFATAQVAGAAEQIQIQVPNEKVGLIIGRGGETIKSLQTRSGARIQLIPQHLPDGDQSKERTVRVSGDRKQIEVAKELMNEVMSQIWLLPFTWGQHCSLEVAINHDSISCIKERYRALTWEIAGC